MTKSGPPTRLAPSEYEAIEQAMMETSRGRWFLSQFAEKNRRKDTQVVLEAISRLESTVGNTRSHPEADRIKMDLVEMSKAIERTRHEIANLKLPEQDGGNLLEATEELDAIVSATERATTKILQAAEDIQETAWTIREDGTFLAPCARIDNNVTDIYTACSFQDITGQRTQKVVQVLRYLEARINAMVSIWGLDKEDTGSSDRTSAAGSDLLDRRPDSHLLNGPQLDGDGLRQDDIDDVMDGGNHTRQQDPSDENRSEFEITADFLAETASEVEALTIKAVEVAEELIHAAGEISLQSDDMRRADAPGKDIASSGSLSEIDIPDHETSDHKYTSYEADLLEDDELLENVSAEEPFADLISSPLYEDDGENHISAESEPDQQTDITLQYAVPENTESSPEGIEDLINTGIPEEDPLEIDAVLENLEMTLNLELEPDEVQGQDPEENLAIDESPYPLPFEKATIAPVDPVKEKRIEKGEDVITQEQASFVRHFEKIKQEIIESETRKETKHPEGEPDNSEGAEESCQISEQQEDIYHVHTLVSEVSENTSSISDEPPAQSHQTKANDSTVKEPDNRVQPESSNPRQGKSTYRTSDWVGKNLELFEEDPEENSGDKGGNSTAQSLRKLTDVKKAALFE